MCVCVCVSVCGYLAVALSYQYVRLDGSMSIKKRQKMVDRFNDPLVSQYVVSCNPHIYGMLHEILILVVSDLIMLAPCLCKTPNYLYREQWCGGIKR